ncbi:MAG: aminodeoxychorismate synthase component I [Erythrobacter sp.]|uniref:aminodeoxychorismate synthase component I n=1 Tax=Erythrobacter sp. TaxID=1042 RepID=UPI003C773FA3
MVKAASSKPFVLLDDARETGDKANAPADALLYEGPREIFVARRPDDVAAVLKAAEEGRRKGGELAGFIAYEAGLALEPRLAALADARSGAGGPLVWLGLFDAPERIAAGDVRAVLAERFGPFEDARAGIGPLDPQVSPGGYVEAFEALREAIRAGDIYQANLTYPLAGSYRGHPMAIYSGLRGSAAAGYGGVVFDGTHWLLSFSPELFVASDGRSVKAKPMKGTRPRAAESATDQALADDLASSVKDKAENLMIVDLMRNDLSRVAEAGSVRVDAPFAVETYPTVHQMVSGVRAQLATGKTAFDLVRALFPCGSITGAPKIRAMELINAVERDARGAYCGAIGRIGSPAADGGSVAAFNVAIRTLRLSPVENDQGDAVLGVGSAIVADSDSMSERRECEVKAGFVRRAHSPGEPQGVPMVSPTCDLIETMAFDPETGVALLELHLERARNSAKALGFSFDRHAARNQIQALCFQLEHPTKLRLLASRSGALALETGPLPQPFDAPVKVAALPNPLDPSDWRLRHKTTDRGFYDDACAAARTMGAFEAILVGVDGLVTEGSITNVFLAENDKEDATLLTPPAALGLLPGVLRAYLLEKGQAREAELTLDDLSGGFLLGNAVRGLFEARLA